MKFHAISRSTPLGELPQSRCALISITDPGLTHPEFPPGRFADALRLSFFDIEEPMLGLRCMSAEDADRLWRFIQDMSGSVDHVVIQCDRGVGRSVGIAAALERIYHGNEAFGSHLKPNRLAEQMVLEAARRSPEGQNGTVKVPDYQADKISICIRVKYSVNRLLAMLLCLQRQTYRNWEALVVTDGPNPHARQLVEDFGDRRVLLLETPKPMGFWGHPYREWSIQRCAGSVIGLTNDDNYYVPGYFDQMINLMKQSGADLVLCDMVHAGLGWQSIQTGPAVCKCDLGNWLVKARIAQSTPWPGFDVYDDGRYVEALARKSKVAILRRILFIKN